MGNMGIPSLGKENPYQTGLKKSESRNLKTPKKAKTPPTSPKNKTKPVDSALVKAKIAGRITKNIAKSFIPLGYRKLYNGEKLNKYDWARTIGVTAVYLGGLALGGPLGLALAMGGRATSYGSLGVQYRKQIAAAARNLASSLKDGRAKAALKKLAHPGAVAKAGVGSLVTLGTAAIAAAAQDPNLPDSAYKNGHLAPDGFWGDIYNGNEILGGETSSCTTYGKIFDRDQTLNAHYDLYLKNPADPALVNASSTDDTVVAAHHLLYDKNPLDPALINSKTMDQYVLASHAALAAKNPNDPALVNSPTYDKYVAAAQKAYDQNIADPSAHAGAPAVDPGESAKIANQLTNLPDDAVKNGHLTTYNWGGTYNGQDVYHGATDSLHTQSILGGEEVTKEHAAIYANNHTDPLLLSSATTDDYVLAAHQELASHNPADPELVNSPTMDQYVLEAHKELAAHNPADPALVNSPTTDQYVEAAQKIVDDNIAREAAAHTWMGLGIDTPELVAGAIIAGALIAAAAYIMLGRHQAHS